MYKNYALIPGFLLALMMTVMACQGFPYGSPPPAAEAPPIYGSLSRNTGLENTITLWATGKGVQPYHVSSEAQAQVMAERAAIADAYRLLAEKIRGTFLSTRQQVDNMAVDYDRIKMSTNTWLRGAEVVSVKHTPDDIVEAVVKVTIPADPAPQCATTASQNKPIN